MTTDFDDEWLKSVSPDVTETFDDDGDDEDKRLRSSLMGESDSSEDEDYEDLKRYFEDDYTPSFNPNRLR